MLDANQGQNALAQALQFHQAIGVTGLVLTKLDGTAKGGIVIAIARKLGLPIRFIGIGEQAEDFGEFDAAGLRRRARRGGRANARMQPPARPHDPLRARHQALSQRARGAHDVSFEIRRGEMVFLTGRSGAGKSTVLKLIALLERPTRGRPWWSMARIWARCKARHVPAYRRSLGVVFQDHKLLPDRPVFDNVALPLVVAGASLNEMDKRVRAALDQVGLARQGAHAAQRAVGRRAAARGHRTRRGRKPSVLIADEPTGNLDPDLAVEVMRLFKRFQDVGVTVIVATHDLHVVQEFGQRAIVLDDGPVDGGEPPLPT